MNCCCWAFWKVRSLWLCHKCTVSLMVSVAHSKADNLVLAETYLKGPGRITPKRPKATPYLITHA